MAIGKKDKLGVATESSGVEKKRRAAYVTNLPLNQQELFSYLSEQSLIQFLVGG